jgi:hypothetical protein
MANVPFTWGSDDASFLASHGTLDGMLGAPRSADAAGVARLAYVPREEPADGNGDVVSVPGGLSVSVPLVDIVSRRYDVPLAALGVILGERSRRPIAVEWHGRIRSL